MLTSQVLRCPRCGQPNVTHNATDCYLIQRDACANGEHRFCGNPDCDCECHTPVTEAEGDPFPMSKVTLVIKRNGEIEFAVADGDFESAKTAIEQTIEQLRAAGIDFAELGDIERHRHDDPHEHITQHQHA